ncbi:hypothetical protein ACO0QE_003446 [Hanseniaspora vineae]
MARQNFIGVVVSQGKMIKTVKVRIEKKKFDARINKYVFLKKDYLVHDEAEVSREGDLVRIESTRPLSKRKFFSIAEIMKNKGQQNALHEQNAKTQIMQEENIKTQEFLSRRREQQENADISLVSDVMVLKQYYQLQNGSATLSSPIPQELLNKVEEVKTRYNLNDDLSSDSVKKLLTLDLESLKQKTLNKTEKLLDLHASLNELLKDEAKCNEILTTYMKVEDPQSLKKNIKKNILRKYLLKSVEGDYA